MKENAITAVYFPINRNWPAMLRARLVRAIPPAKPGRVGWVWTAKDAGNGDKSTTISANMMTPPRVYMTRAGAVKAAKRIGWIVGDINRSIARAAASIHDAYGDTMDLYAAIHRRLDSEELEKIGSIWRQLSKAARVLRELDLDATLGR